MREITKYKIALFWFIGFHLMVLIGALMVIFMGFLYVIVPLIPFVIVETLIIRFLLKDIRIEKARLIKNE